MAGFQDVRQLSREEQLQREAERMDAMSPMERAQAAQDAADELQRNRAARDETYGDVNVVPSWFNASLQSWNDTMDAKRARDFAAIQARRRTV